MNDVDDEDAVTKALRKARYNEIVHISIDASNEDGGDNSKIGDNDRATKSVSLIPRLNEQQGGIQFLNLVDCCRDSTANIDEAELVLQKELQTKRWFFPMLNDTHRNQRYHEAIQEVIRYVKKNRNFDKNNINILDIGSGSGLLSLMFAKECSSIVPDSQIHITSVEMSNAFGTLAQRTLEENTSIHGDPNIDMIIHQGQHSTASTFNSKLNDSDTINDSGSGSYIQYDVCISELFEHGLLGEGWIPSIRDAWWRHLSLSPPAIVVPCGAKVYGVIVKSPWLSHYCRPLHRPYTFTTSCDGHHHHHHTLSLDLPNDGNEQYLLDSCHVQLPIHANKLIRDKQMTLASSTELIFRLNVSSAETIPTLEGQTSTVTFTMAPDTLEKMDTGADTGAGYGILIWWDMVLWEDRESGNDIIYSLQPNLQEQQPFQDHWCPCLHLLPSEDALFKQDDTATVSTVEVTFRHDDYRIFVDNVKPTSPDHLESDTANVIAIDPTMSRVKRIKTELYGNKIQLTKPLPPPAYVSQERAFQLNDRQRIRIFQNALEYAILYKHRQNESDATNTPASSATVTIVDVSDFALGACIAASMCHAMSMGNGTRYRIVSVENSSGHLPMLASQVLSKAIPNLQHTNPVDLSILKCYNENITLDAIGTGTQAVDIVFSEPYYEVLEGWHLQEALNFYYVVHRLRSNGIINKETIVLPCVCRVMGCVIESPTLRRAYGPCGDKKSASIHGISHAYANRIGRDGRGNDITMSMWQYDFAVLSQTFELGILEYMNPNAPTVPTATNVASTFHTRGRCDALLVWLEYSFALPSTSVSDKKTDETVLSTNCQSYNQIIHMLGGDNEVSDIQEGQVVCRATYGGNRFESHHFDVMIKGR